MLHHRSPIRRSTRCLALALLVTAGAAASAQTVTPGNYSFETIEVPGALSTEASDIDKWGTVVGYSIDATGTQGFLYDEGSFTSFALPGYDGTTLIGSLYTSIPTTGPLHIFWHFTSATRNSLRRTFRSFLYFLQLEPLHR